MDTLRVSTILQALLLAAAAHNHQHKEPFKQSGFPLQCGGDCGGTCIGRPKGICSYADADWCPEELCVPDIESDPCAHGVCPAGHECTADAAAAGGYACATDACDSQCEVGELCFVDADGGAWCTAAGNEKGAVFDGRNAEGVYVPCQKHADCYAYREPVEWYCCKDKADFGHRWTKRGAYCDPVVGTCAIERHELGRLRWTLVVPKKAVEDHDCKVACPCC